MRKANRLRLAFSLQINDLRKFWVERAIEIEHVDLGAQIR